MSRDARSAGSEGGTASTWQLSELRVDGGACVNDL